MRGVSLIETLIVIALIGFLSTIGINTFINFKNDTSIDNITNELISDIKLARNKSMNGELLLSESELNFDENGLPEYGLEIATDGYRIKRTCVFADGTNCDGEILDAISYTDDFKKRSIDTQYTLSPVDFNFERINGRIKPPGSLTITVQEKSGAYGREIEISNDFIITIKETP